MARKKKTTKPDRLFRRGKRWYADLRDYADVQSGDGRLSLGTADPDEAAKRLAAKLTELDERRDRGLGSEAAPTTFGAFTELEITRQERRVTEGTASAKTQQWITQRRKHLTVAAEFFAKRFKSDPPMKKIGKADVRAYWDHLETLKNGGGRPLSGGTIRHYLNAVSWLFGRASAYDLVNHNPVSQLAKVEESGLPKSAKGEAPFFDHHNAALILEAARHLPRDPDTTSVPLYPMIAVMLLTGARKSEMLTMQVEDIDHDHAIVRVMNRKGRKLRADAPLRRIVPLWPQLNDILAVYLQTEHPNPVAGELLFPSFVTGKAQPFVNIDKALDALADYLSWKPKAHEPKLIRSHGFRHTYCSVRAQSLDRGYPVALETVQQELGHSDIDTTRNVYLHFQNVRHRSENVEYHVEDFRKELGVKRLALVGL